MSWFHGLRHRLRTVLAPGRYDRELSEEIAHHRSLRDGQRGPHARHFGNATYYKEETRRSTWLGLADVLGQDIRYAVRGLRTRPTFAAGVIITLGLGIGANAVMFGITDRLLFRSPPMLRDQATVHRLYRTGLSNGAPVTDRNLSFATYLDLKDATRSVFTNVTSFQTQTLPVGEGTDARMLKVTVAAAGYFDFFDVRPVLGRLFSAADDSVGASPVVVLGHACWLTQFGGRNVIGEQLRVGARQLTIIGVAPPGFVGISDQGVPALFTPIVPHSYSRAGANYTRTYSWTWLEIIARRRPGVSEETARRAAEAGFVASWRKASAVNPRLGSAEDRRIGALLGPVQMGRGPQADREADVARWVSGVALIVLLIACVNVTNLMLARAVSRRREIAMRLALGVSRGRLLRQLLTESAVLAVVGGVAGLVIAQWGGAAIRAMYLPSGTDVAVITDARTLLFSALLTAAAALATGLLPALDAGRGNVVAALKAGQREGGERRGRLRNGLLVFQAALSTVLLVGAALFVRSLANARAERLGYDASRLLIAEVVWRGLQVTSVQEKALQDEFLVAARAVPGVERVALSESVPFYSNSEPIFRVPGVDTTDRIGRFLAQVATPEYFQTMGSRLVRGRAITADDRPTSPPVVVVSEAMARMFWPGADPLGKCVLVAVTEGPCTTVVGVAEDVRLATLAGAREFTYYLAAAQFPNWPPAYLVARTSGDAGAHVAAIRARLQAIVPSPAYVRVTPLSDFVEPNYRSWQLGATMFVAFASLALVLAAVGLYSLSAFEVAQRAREMSLRMALGAPSAAVARMVVGQGVLLAGAGVGLGLAVAAGLAPRLGNLMFRVDARDPLILGGVGVTLVLVGAVACALPARRATRADPAAVLRGE